MLELAILGLLKDQPLHGYELRKRLGESLGFLWGVSYGSLYPALRRLEHSGAIEVVDPAVADAAPAAAPGAPIPATGSITGDLAAAHARRRALPKPSRRTRKAYRITARGEAAFAELMLEETDGGDDERAFTLKFAFCRHLPPAERITILERRRADLAARLARAERSRAPSALDRYARSLMEHRTKSIERDLEWVDELLAAEHAAAEPETPEGATA